MEHNLKIGDEVIVDIKRLGINGEGIGYYKKLAVFVKDAIPGEGMKVRITSTTPKMAYAEIVEMLHPSKDRVNPECMYYGECGGCQTQHIKYNVMLKVKRELLIESISRYTTLNPRSFEIKDTIGMENPWHYRNKSSLLIRRFTEGASVCMIKENSNIFIPINTCLVQNKKINEVNQKICKLVDSLDVKTYNSKTKMGILKYLVTRVSLATSEVQVCFVCQTNDHMIKSLAEKTIAIEGVESVYMNINNDPDNVLIFGEETTLLYGKPYITEVVGKSVYNLTPKTFFQLNTVQTFKMYEEIKKACKLSFKEDVLDAFCGVGTIGIYLSKMAKSITGIEYSMDSVNAAKENATLNKIKNATFYQGDTVALLPKMLADGSKFDCIVLDPPRVGLGDTLSKVLLESNTKRIVYVSCNPSTFAKDLAILSMKYNVKYIQPIDMFPFTSLVESICLLELKK